MADPVILIGLAAVGLLALFLGVLPVMVGRRAGLGSLRQQWPNPFAGRVGRTRPLIRPTHPVVLAPSAVAPTEPPLMNTAIDCSRQTSVLQGRCAGDGGVATLTVRAASLRGVGHAVAGRSGQDAAAVRWHAQSHVLCVAVADGLGSLPDSGRAARTAVEAAVRYAVCATSGPATGHGRAVFDRVATAIEQVVGPDGLDHRARGATTLTLAEVWPVPAGARIRISGVGDSEAWLLGPDGWRPLHHERNEARENITRQLPRHPMPSSNEVRAPRGSVLLLATDGFAGSITARSHLGRTLEELWRTVPTPLEFATHVDFVDAYCTDDRTAVAIWIGDRDGSQ